MASAGLRCGLIVQEVEDKGDALEKAKAAAAAAKLTAFEALQAGRRCAPIVPHSSVGVLR